MAPVMWPPRDSRMSALLPPAETTWQRPHWLADDAVLIGPVSTSNSLEAGHVHLPNSAPWLCGLLTGVFLFSKAPPREQGEKCSPFLPCLRSDADHNPALCP